MRLPLEQPNRCSPGWSHGHTYNNVSPLFQPNENLHLHHIVDPTRSSKHLASDHVMNIALIPFLR
jgi:hypothetical protein